MHMCKNKTCTRRQMYHNFWTKVVKIQVEADRRVTLKQKQIQPKTKCFSHYALTYYEMKLEEKNSVCFRMAEGNQGKEEEGEGIYHFCYIFFHMVQICHWYEFQLSQTNKVGASFRVSVYQSHFLF